MGKNKSASGLTNFVQYDNQGNIFFVSGSNTLMSISSSGAITTTGVISGSNALSSSFAVSSSFALTGTTAATASSVGTLNQNVVITGSLTTTGQIVAQTLNVQQVTSSIVFSSGSNIFGNLLTNTQQLTGSVTVTGSFAVATTGTELQVGATGVTLGNVITDNHNITGSVRVSGSLTAGGLTVSSTTNAGSIIATNSTTGYSYIDLINSGASGRNYQIGIAGNGAATGYANNLYFDLVGTGSIMTLTSGRNVGIGETSPNSKLDVVGSSNNPSTYGTLTIRNSSSTGISIGAFSTSYTWIQGNVYGSGTAPLLLNPQGGNVLIGTTNTANGHKLEIIAGSTSAVRIDVTSGTNGISMSPGAVFGIDKPGVGGGTFRITSGGNVGINQNNPQAAFQINGRGGADIIFQMNDESNIRRCFYIPNQFYGYMWAVGVVSNGGKAFSFGNQDGTEVGTIVINAGGVAYNTTSDYRLKEDLRDFNGLEKVCAIKVYDFKWKNLDERVDGVLAHELAEVVPYAVSGVKDALNHEGNIEAQSVDYSKLTPILVKAIQELKAEFDEYKATHP